MAGGLAPSSNGFPIHFYRVCWEVIREDLMLVVKDFYEKAFLDKGNSSSFIVLIPKRLGQVPDFRPVSFIGSTYKIISKCLALCLKEVLSLVIFKEQGVFLQGKSTFDRVLCANKCIDAWIKEGKLGVICKLDIEKVYDCVNWDFLEFVLGRCGFGIR